MSLLRSMYCRTLVLSSLAAGCCGMMTAPRSVPSAVNLGTVAAHHGPSYAGSLEYVFADIKKPLAGTKGNMKSGNYKTIVDGLMSNLHCNGLRIPIDPNITDPTKHDQLFGDVLKYAKEQGLLIYASPLGTGTFEKSKDAYIEWIVGFANEWQPDVLAPFNEAGLEGEEYIDYADKITSQLSYRPKYVGPDKQHVDDTIQYLQQYPKLITTFDVVNSHNAESDESAYESNWNKLADLAGASVWSTENPREWSDLSSNNVEIGIKAVVDSKAVSGLVLYLAYPNSVDDDGKLTEKGQAIADGIYSAESGWWSKWLSPFKSITDKLHSK